MIVAGPVALVAGLGALDGLAKRADSIDLTQSIPLAVPIPPPLADQLNVHLAVLLAGGGLLAAALGGPRSWWLPVAECGAFALAQIAGAAFVRSDLEPREAGPIL